MIKKLCAALVDDDLLEIIAYAVYHPTREQVQKIISDYIGKEGKKALVFRNEGLNIGCIAYSIIKGEIEIDYIGVKIDNRGIGIAKKLVDEMIRREEPKRIYLETDLDAVDFYRRIGFNIKSIGNKYEDTERFLCDRNICS